MKGNEAQKQNPALEPFSIFVGEWSTTGTHPYVPGTTFHGRASIQWIKGGAFLTWRTEIDEPEIPTGISIIGSDDKSGEYFILYFDERGISRKYDVTIKGK